MALSRKQHNQIMQVYQDRRLFHQLERNRREEEICLHVPMFQRAEEELQSLRMSRAVRLLHHEGDSREALSELARMKELEEEKKSLLRQNGYPEDYLEPVYDCPLCHDTGYVGQEKCSCHKKLISGVIYEGAGLPVSMKDDSFETFDPEVFDDTEALPELIRQKDLRLTQRQYMLRVKLTCQKFVRDFSRDPGNLLFMGQAGTGKTFLSTCIARELIADCRQVLYVKSVDFFESLEKKRYGGTEEQEEGIPASDAYTCDLLILDDLGTELTTNYTLSKLFSILENRLLHKKPMILSTNLTLNGISRVYGDRMVSRLIQSFTIIPFYGKDIRLKKGES